jgi:hypothetical protein
VAIDVPDWLQLTQLAAPGDLGSVAIQPGQSSVFVTVNLSPYATALLIVCYNAYALISWQVTGGVTSYPYISQFSISNPSPTLVANIGGATDNPITVEAITPTVNGTGIAQIVGHIYQLFGTGTQLVNNTPAQPLSTKLIPSIAQLGQQQLITASIAVSPAAGAALTVVAPVAGQQLVVYGYDWGIDPAAPVVGQYIALLEDTGPGVVISRIRMRVSTVIGVMGLRAALDIPLGLPLQQGAGIRVLNSASSSGVTECEGTVLYASLPYIL